MKSTAKKKFLLITGIVLSAFIITVLSYAAYVLFSYDRLPDNITLDIEKGAGKTAVTGEKLSIVTYNIGFGAYSQDYSFFMDGGEHSRALSENAVKENTQGALKTVQNADADFILFQEVDIYGTRSYHVNQCKLLSSGLSKYDSVFALNYDSPYFLYPLNEPIGANKSGILTFSSFSISSAVRKSLPVEDSLYKLFDLDRAYTVSVIPTDNGKNLVLYNLHLSAYTSDGKIADEQLKILCADMQKEYQKGSYVIAAGDFNKDLLGDSSEYFGVEPSEEFNWAKPFDTSILPDGIKCYTGTNAPTCRNADSAYRGDGTDFVLSVDGVLASDNVKVISCNTIDTRFLYSDHNPVKAEFILN